MRQIRRTVDRDVERVLRALRNRIRERGYTQKEVQEALDWGGSYISQLVTRQKGLRIDQILQILNVIHVTPADFFDEIFQFSDAFRPAGSRPAKSRGKRRVASSPSDSEALHRDLREVRRLFHGIVRVLIRKNLITANDLKTAAARSRNAAE